MAEHRPAVPPPAAAAARPSQRLLPPPAPPYGNWQSLVGRTIEAVVTRHHPGIGPRTVVHLVFSDGNTFEIFSTGGSTLGGNSRLYRGNLAEVLSYEPPNAELRVFGADPLNPR